MSAKEWLTNFLIDLCLNIMTSHCHNANDYSIIDAHISSQLFRDCSKVEKGFFEKAFSCSATYIIMPTLINNNHWCLGVVDKINNTFSWINPWGESEKVSQIYLKKFLDIMHTLNSELCHNTWRIKLLPHTKQASNDNDNCGVYVLYFFQQFLANKPLDNPVDIMEYRKALQLFLLKSSDCMTPLCISCSRSDINEQKLFCRCCLRYYHLRCADTPDFDMCELCTQYLNTEV